DPRCLYAERTGRLLLLRWDERGLPACGRGCRADAAEEPASDAVPDRKHPGEHGHAATARLCRYSRCRRRSGQCADLERLQQSLLLLPLHGLSGRDSARPGAYPGRCRPRRPAYALTASVFAPSTRTASASGATGPNANADTDRTLTSATSVRAAAVR